MLFNAFFGAFFLMGQTEDYKAIMDFVSNCVDIAAVLMLTKQKKFFKTLLLVFLFGFSADMLYSLISPYISQQLYVECLINIVLFGAVILLIVAFVKNSTFNVLPQVFNEIPKWLFVVLLIFELTCYYRQFGVSLQWYNALYVISQIGILAVVIFLVFKIFALSYQQSAIIKQLELQKAFGEKAVLSDEELRRFRHDYKNHMIVVNAYLSDGKIDEARQYLNLINNQFSSRTIQIKSGNFVADAILNHKAIVAKEQGISLNFDGMIPKSGINDNDLCTILSNLIDNAIEGCSGLTNENKFITAKATSKNDLFALNIQNPTVLQALPQKTTKRDSVNHGLGLKNVRRVVDRYNGTISANVENGVYEVDVYLTMEK